MSQGVSRIRLVVIQILVLSLLGTLLGRLWYIQVLAGGEAQALAERTSTRLVYERAPRGFLFDREGRTLARNRTALTVALDTSRVPEEMKDGVIAGLASTLDMDEAEVRAIVEDDRIGPHTPRPIALDVALDDVIYLREHSDVFPGVTDLEIPVREYPHGPLAAHVIGHIGEVTQEEIDERAAERAVSEETAASLREYRPADLVGKVGVERAYEDWLAGKSGVKKLAVDVQGKLVEEVGNDPPERGMDAILTIDAELQLATEDALDNGMELARRLVDPDTGENYVAPAGAVVALDPRNGEVLTLASAPDFDPNLFVGSTDRDRLAELNSPDAHMPFLNRAIAEAVPPGSTFKPMTAAAAWDADPTIKDRTFHCPGFFRVGNRVFRDWTPKGHGTVGLSRSLAESCDIIYYTVGVEMDAQVDDLGEHVQNMARGFGFGSPTGIDLRGEQEGLVPDAEWKWNRFSYAQTYDRRWFPGDAANLAIGQGFLQTTPLQLAVGYAAIANGGTLYRPHVVKCLSQLDVSRAPEVDEACAEGVGVFPEKASPKVNGQVEVAPGALSFMEEAMAGTVVGEGTAAVAFEGFPHDRVFVSGKSGTAQMKPRQPFSWFAATARAGDKEIVVVALVEEGGTGSQIAAPIVRRVIESHFDVPEGSFEAGVRAD